MIETHAKVLKASLQEGLTSKAFEEPWRTNNPRKWAEYVGFEHCDQLTAASLNRAGLRDELRAARSSKAAAALILAWGGMNRRYGRLLFKEEEWTEIVADLRAGRLSASDAYQRFEGLRSAKKLPGMGPAYFTKLIFFLGDQNGRTGFIMDQWTATSVNLLLGNTVVVMDRCYPKGARVSDRNSVRNYEAFNESVLAIAHDWQHDPEIIEMALFGRGHPQQDRWRKHVSAALSLDR